MKKLNAREKEVAKVAVDLFLKGTPEWRIADYGHRRGFTNEQFSIFLDKLGGIPDEVSFVIMTHFKDIGKSQCHDKAKANGVNLHRWLARA